MTQAEINIWMAVYSGVAAIQYHPKNTEQREGVSFDVNVSFTASLAADVALERWRETLKRTGL